MTNRNCGILIILTGKTASGKDTIKSKLLGKYPNLKKVITTTSRAPREGEKDGVDYHFLSRKDFEKKITSGDFAEHVEYGGNLYGTTKSELEASLNQDTLWRIDPSRAGEIREFIKRAFPDEVAEKLIKSVIVIYVAVSDKVVLQRLRERNLSEDEIENRMADDAKIWDQYKENYDFVVENIPRKLNETVDKICKIIDTQKEHKNIF